MVEGSFAPTTRIVAPGAIMREVVRNMVGIFRPRELVLMTTIAVRRRISESIGMAGDASGTCMRTRQREYRIAVIKSGRLPRRRAMTIGAVMIEVVRRVIRVLGRDELVLMAVVTCRRCARESSTVA